MKEVTAEVEQQLVEAQAELAQSMEADGPPVEEMAATEALKTVFGAAGSGQAKHILLDHYFTGALRRLWVHSGGAWRYRNVTNIEEQGLAQVAFASDRVDSWWDSSNILKIMRCWKNF
jgi:hypothetical protein